VAATKVLAARGFVKRRRARRAAYARSGENGAWLEIEEPSPSSARARSGAGSAGCSRAPEPPSR
jgi:hypothetical protein